MIEVFFQRLLHMGDRLVDVVVGLGRQRREVDGESRQEFPFDALFGREFVVDFGLESVQFVFYRFDRIVVVHQLPDVVGVERRAEQGVARSRKNAVRKGDVFLGSPCVPACEFADQKVQRLLAAVDVPGFLRFGERRFPIGCGEVEAVSAQVGQLDVYPLPADGIVCFR